MSDEDGQLTPLPEMSRKARWSFWLAVLSMTLYLVPCFLPVVVDLLSAVRGEHIHPQSQLQSLLLTAAVVGSLGMQVMAIVLGVFAFRDIRRSSGSLRGTDMARVGTISGVTLLVAFGMLYPMVQLAREAANRTSCRCAMKQLGLAMHNYNSTYGSFPPAATYDEEGQPLLSWRVLLLPFLADQTLYDRFHLDEPWDSPNNLPLAGEMPEVFHCPSDRTSKPNCTSYVVAVGDATFFPLRGTIRTEDIKDGTANTVMVGEIATSTIIWSKPEDLAFDDKFMGRGNFSSKHPRGWNVVMGDGTCRWFDETTDPKILRAIMTIAGREEIDWRGF